MFLNEFDTSYVLEIFLVLHLCISQINQFTFNVHFEAMSYNEYGCTSDKLYFSLKLCSSCTN